MAKFTGYKLEEGDLYSTLSWVEQQMATRKPDVTLRDGDRLYLERWRLMPPNPQGNIYLHRFSGDDPGPECHDHRIDNRTWLLRGPYREHVRLADGEVVTYLRRTGDVIVRPAEVAHRVELLDERPVISVFYYGPVRREWGFHTVEGWKQHEEYHRWIRERAA